MVMARAGAKVKALEGLMEGQMTHLEIAVVVYTSTLRGIEPSTLCIFLSITWVRPIWCAIIM